MNNPKEDFEKFQKENIPTEEDIKDKIAMIHAQIVAQIKKYCDLEEYAYNIIGLWILGTWVHKYFNSYPYLFFNAIKGSGKSRILNLISSLSWNGKVLISISESVLFRTAAFRTLCIDEFESVGNKEKQALRELLNASYKRGGTVERAYKKKGLDREKIEIESFDVYCPIAMANIWGMDNVLSDRCTTVVLDKSNKKGITRLMENFELDPVIQNLKKEILRTFSDTCAVTLLKNRLEETPQKWNYYVSKETLLTLHTQETQVPQVALSPQELDFFDKINGSGLEGRPLELFFPLFVLSDIIGNLHQTIETSKHIIKEKKAQDISESRDVSLVDYLSKTIKTDDFLSINKIYEDMKEDEKDWISPDWIGRALNRLKVVIERRRMARRREVRINWSKVDELVKILLPRLEIEESKIEIV